MSASVSFLYVLRLRQFPSRYASPRRACQFLMSYQRQVSWSPRPCGLHTSTQTSQKYRLDILSSKAVTLHATNLSVPDPNSACGKVAQ